MESPISTTSSSHHVFPDSFMYEADESEPESPSDFTPTSTLSLKDKFYLNSYVLIGSQGKILNGTKKKKSIIGNSESSRSGSVTPVSISSLETSGQLLLQLRLSAHYDLDHSTGFRRGLAGSRNDHLSFLSVPLFSLFYFSNSCDSWILSESEAKAKASTKSAAIRKALTQEIIYSLRTSYFCPKEKVLKLYKTIFPQMSSPQPLEVGKFLNVFFEDILNLHETTHYTSTTSEIILTLKSLKFLEKDESTLQRLMEITLMERDRKLLSIPRPILILSLPSSLTSLPHEPFVPNLRLDLSPFLIRLRQDNNSSSSDSEYEAIRSYRARQSATKQSVVNYIKEGFSSAFSHLQVMVEQIPQLFSPSEAILSVTENNSTNQSMIPSEEVIIPSSPTRIKLTKRPEVLMDLMAVICLDKHGNYSAFVRCGHNPRRGFSPWTCFNPAGVNNISEVRLLDKNFTKSLRKLERLRYKKLIVDEWKIFPKEIHDLLTYSTLFIYDTKPQAV